MDCSGCQYEESCMLKDRRKQTPCEFREHQHNVIEVPPEAVLEMLLQSQGPATEPEETIQIEGQKAEILSGLYDREMACKMAFSELMNAVRQIDELFWAAVKEFFPQVEGKRAGYNRKDNTIQLYPEPAEKAKAPLN